MGFADMCCWAFAERNVVTETFVGWIYTCKELCLFIDRNRVYWGSKLSFSAYQCMRPSSNLSGLGHRLVYYLLTLPLPLTILGNLQLGPGTELKARLGALEPLVFSLPCLLGYYCELLELAWHLCSVNSSLAAAENWGCWWKREPLAVGENWGRSWKMEQNSCEKWLSWGTLGF